MAHSKEETFVPHTGCHILIEFAEHSDDDGEQISFYPHGWDNVGTQCSGQHITLVPGYKDVSKPSSEFGVQKHLVQQVSYCPPHSSY